MIRSIDEVAVGSRVRTDVLVVGGGAAGITLALELEGRGLDVTLLEAGGAESTETSTARYRGELVTSPGLEYPDLDSWRLRFLGGTTNHWAGWCRPLEDNVFDHRPWIGDAAWPIGLDELREPYERANEICELGRPEYSLATIAADVGAELPLVETERLRHTMWRFSPPTRFGKRYREDLSESAADVVLGANVVGFAVTGRTVGEVFVADDVGATRTWVADRVVLASGGLENCRHLLVLASQGVATLDRSGWLGRGFMEHPHVLAAIGFADEALTREGSPLAPFLRESVDVDGTPIIAGLTLRSEYAEERSMANLSFTIGTHRAELVESFEHGTAIRELRELVDPVGPGAVRLFCRSEQRCRPASRVELTDAVDDLGVPRIRLNWRLDDGDVDDIATGVRVIAEELAGQGLGPLRRTAALPQAPAITGGGHHMGGARMSDDPDLGVVDRHGRTHALDNLYVAGGAVFPTSGYSNPTLTVVALAVRLATHLSR